MEGGNDDYLKNYDKIHPLLIDHVVEKVLESLDPELLGHYCKTFRLVCKDWQRIASKVYKSRRGTIVFKKNFIGRVSGLFLRVMKTSSVIPFETFKFLSDCYDKDHFEELLHVCSHAMLNLEINLVNPCDLRFPPDWPYLHLKNLKSLRFFVRLDIRGSYLQLDMPNLLECLLKAATNLESLDVVISGGLAQRSTESALECSALVKKFGDVLVVHLPETVRHLKLNMTLTEAQLGLLTEKNLKVQTLEVYFQQSHFSQNLMQAFLAKLAPNIVRCKAIGNQFLMPITYPVFPKLTNLVALARAPATVCYKTLFPKLDKLDVVLWDEDQSGSIFPPNCYSSSLQHVTLKSVVTSDSGVFERIGRSFPNLRKLTGVTILTEEALRTVFKSLVGLEVLDLILGKEFHDMMSADFVFTGIAPSSCDMILKLREFGGSSRCNMSEWVPGESLRSLKELKSLRLTVTPFRSAKTVKLTDVTVFYAIFHLKKLTRLCLDYFPISDHIVEQLQKTYKFSRP